MGEYFAQLDVLEFDMGKFEDEDDSNKNQEESKISSSEGAASKATTKGAVVKQTAWAEWWSLKQVQNNKLK